MKNISSIGETVLFNNMAFNARDIFAFKTEIFGIYKWMRKLQREKPTERKARGVSNNKLQWELL